ncbi:hypothetical protein [Paenarthrobacter sp. FR1]|uniref:hypothetical protein n=1 Tax=Paenarthrobacter sp. FR1 TaxID=3439548 RepID=UPI003DA31CD6
MRLQPAKVHTAEQEVHRTESACTVCPATGGHGDEAISGLTTCGGFHGFAETWRQNAGQAPLAKMFEGQQALCQFIPVGPRGHHPDLRRAIHVDQRGRFLLCTERLLAQLPYAFGASAAERRVLNPTADALNWNQEGGQITHSPLHPGHEPRRTPLIYPTTTSPGGLGCMKIGVDAMREPALM